MFKKITQALSISLLIMYASAAEAKRVALIVGNAAYKNENVLSNPINDARLIAKTLQNDLGFDDVKIIENADMRSLNRAVDEFGRKANGADAAFVYFSGHGLQTTDKQNYLLAVDAQIEQESDIKVSAITSEALVEATEGAKIRLVVLDACRDRPNSVYKTKSATKGLTRAKDPSINGLLIAYATEDGKVAQDGRSGGNSPYAAALVAELKKRDKPIMAMFDEVMESVVKQTNGTQKPTRSGDLTVKMYLVDPVIIPAVAISTVDSEKEFWDEVKNSTTANDYAAYLEQYPKGRFMVLARSRKAQYEKVPTTPNASSVKTDKQDTLSADELKRLASTADFGDVVKNSSQPLLDTELVFWNSIINSGDVSEYTAYLEQFPNGRFVTLAKSRQKKLMEQETSEKRMATTKEALKYKKIAITERTKNPQKAQEALWYAADTFDKVQDYDESIGLYLQYVSNIKNPGDVRMEGNYRIYKYYLQNNKITEAKNALKRLADIYPAELKPLPRTRYLGAMAMFKLAQPLYDYFSEIKLTQPLKPSIVAKKKAMLDAIAAYNKVADIGVSEFTTAANYQQAQIFQKMAESLISSERPKGLSDVENEQYGILLEEQAEPLANKAIDIYISNTNLVKQGAYDDYIKKSFTALAALNSRYNKMEQIDALTLLENNTQGMTPAEKVLYQKAIYLMNNQKVEDAFSVFEALQNNTTTNVPILNQAWIRIKQESYKDAEELLQKASFITPNDAYIYNLQGFVYRHLGQFTLANKAYEQALSIDPQYAQIYLNLGILHDLYLQDLQKALVYYENYQKYQPAPNVQVQKWIIDLQKRTGVYKPASGSEQSSSSIINKNERDV